jgi:CheY-like chemotaxis protein
VTKVTKVEEDNPKFQISNLKFQISDTGPGIAPEEMEHLFEPFVQTRTGKESLEGTGLGLPISRKFVQLMGGDITVRSKVGTGSIFTFEIQAKIVEPSAIDNQHAKIPKRVIAIEPGQPRYKMLIVDDKANNRQLLIKMLKPFGFDLREAGNGQEAIEIWQTWRPHVIFMDLRMPVMGGYEATKQIREAEGRKQKAEGGEEEVRKLGSWEVEHQTVIIALSASSFGDERSVALTQECHDFLRKPFQDREIFEMLYRHLGIRFVYEEGERLKVKGEREEKPILEALTKLPEELLSKFRHAVMTTDMSMIENMIEEIRTRDSMLADGLNALAEEFQ